MPHVENIAKTSDIHSGRAAIMQAGSLPSTNRREGSPPVPDRQLWCDGMGHVLGLVRPAGAP